MASAVAWPSTGITPLAARQWPGADVDKPTNQQVHRIRDLLAEIINASFCLLSVATAH